MELGVCWALGALLALCVPGTCSSAAPPGCPPQYATVSGRDKTPCCTRCRPGTFMQDECTVASNSVCAPCPAGSYSELWNNMFSCFRCDECINEGMKYKKNCTSTSNAECECSEGYVYNDANSKSCVLKDEDVQSIPCSMGTYSDTGTEPCQLWTDCTALGRIEVTSANQTSDAICNDTTAKYSGQRGSTDKVRVVTIIAAFISFFLLCLSVGMHIILWRRNRRKEFKFLPTETSPQLLKTRMEDTCSTHFPEQECGGIPHQEKKSIEQAYVAVNCGC